jgi:hypothetical protein
MKTSLLSGATIFTIALLLSGCVAQGGGGNMNSANNPPQQNPQPQDPNQPDPQNPNQGGNGYMPLNPGLVEAINPQPKPGINPNKVPILVEQKPIINPGDPVIVTQKPIFVQNPASNPVKVKPGQINVGQQGFGQQNSGKLNGGLNKKPILIQP